MDGGFDWVWAGFFDDITMLINYHFKSPYDKDYMLFSDIPG